MSAPATATSIAESKPETSLDRTGSPQPQTFESLPNEKVAKLAYTLWQQRGCPKGSAEFDWLEAERKLRHMPEKPTETGHTVRCSRDVNEEKGERIRRALEDRFPTHPVAEFNLKLTPLSVGAWLLIIGSPGDSDYEILGYDRPEIEVTQVLASADLLVARWREKHFRHSPFI